MESGETKAPGKSAKPKSRAKLDPEILAIRNSSYEEFMGICHKYGLSTRRDLDKELKRTDITMFELICRSMVKRAAEGDKDARKELLDRLWGKVRDRQVETGASEGFALAYDPFLKAKAEVKV